MLPVLVGWIVEAAEFGWVVVVLLEDDRDQMLKVLKIFLCSFLEGFVLEVTAEVHELDFSFERDANILGAEIAMGHPHIIEKSIHPQKLLDILIHILSIAPKGIDF